MQLLDGDLDMKKLLLFAFACILGAGLGAHQAFGQCVEKAGLANDGFCKVTGSCGTASQCIYVACVRPSGRICTVRSGSGCFFFGCNCNTVCPNDCGSE